MSALTLRVPSMTCRHCVRKVTARLRDIPGVVAVQADAATMTVVLHGTPAPDDVLAALLDAGFPGTLIPVPATQTDEHSTRAVIEPTAASQAPPPTGR